MHNLGKYIVYKNLKILFKLVVQLKHKERIIFYFEHDYCFKANFLI